MPPALTNEFQDNVSRGAPVPPPVPAPSGSTPSVPAAAARNDGSPPSAALPAAPPTPTVVPENADMDAVLTQMNRELRRWIVRYQRKPSSFQEFASSANLQAPPPPPGKKYVLTKNMRIVLEKR